MVALGFTFDPGLDFNDPEAYHRSACETRFSDIEWEVVVKLLPNRGNDLPRWRRDIESSANVLRWGPRHFPPSKTEMVQRWKEVERLAAALDSAVTGVKDWDENFISPQLCILIDEARSLIRMYERSAPEKKKTKQDNRVEQFLNCTLRLWLVSGGALRTSSHPSTGKASGPLIRFLAATTGPLFRAAGFPAMSPEALRAYVNRFRRAERDRLRRNERFASENEF